MVFFYFSFVNNVIVNSYFFILKLIEFFVEKFLLIVFIFLEKLFNMFICVIVFLN